MIYDIVLIATGAALAYVVYVFFLGLKDKRDSE